MSDVGFDRAAEKARLQPLRDRKRGFILEQIRALDEISERSERVRSPATGEVSLAQVPTLLHQEKRTWMNPGPANSYRGKVVIWARRRSGFKRGRRLRNFVDLDETDSRGGCSCTAEDDGVRSGIQRDEQRRIAGAGRQTERTDLGGGSLQCCSVGRCTPSRVRR